MNSELPEYGIVLSGGGARGLAHIGVIAALEDHGIVPSMVAGSSMGAVIGAFYAAGMTPAEMLEIAKNKKLYSLFNWPLPKRGGMLSLKALKDVLEKNLPGDSFNSLKKELFISVSNISEGIPEIISKGSLVQAVMASSSIPIIFEPQIINGKTYIDGGFFNDLPADPLVGRCRKIIASHVNYNGPDPELASMRSIAERIYRLAIYQHVRSNFDKCDYIIDPPELRKHGIFDFKHIDRLFEIGYSAAETLIKKIGENSAEKPIIVRETKVSKKK